MAVDGSVEVFWITSKELMVKVDGRDYRVTPEEAYALFKDNISLVISLSVFIPVTVFVYFI